MSYAYRSQDLLSLLQTKAPVTTATLAANFRRNEYGLLSVGLKIHCLDNGEKFKELIEGLGGAARILEVNYFKDARASLCLVLPPVGSATSAIHLVQCIEQYIGSPVLANRQIQLQLCSPGRLSARASALKQRGYGPWQRRSTAAGSAESSGGSAPRILESGPSPTSQTSR